MSTFPSYIKQAVAYRSGQIPTADEINSYFNLLIEQGDLTTTAVVNHLADEVRHITAEERTAWNAKEDKTVVAAINVRLTNLENAWHDIVVTGAGINDDLSSAVTTYSSNKINDTFVKKTTEIISTLKEYLTSLVSNVGNTTVFNSDGSITQTFLDGRTTETVFNSDGSITETNKNNGITVKTKTTTFNTDGSITEVII